MSFADRLSYGNIHGYVIAYAWLGAARAFSRSAKLVRIFHGRAKYLYFHHLQRNAKNIENKYL
jgi:hypothetical protein